MPATYSWGIYFMTTKKRIAIALELEWLLKHHQDTFAGTQRYAEQCGDWDCFTVAYPEQFLEGGKNSHSFDGIITRATQPQVDAARAAGVPLVNVWYASPVAEDVVTVTCDNHEVGRMAARYLLERGFRQFCFIGYLRREKTLLDTFEGFSEVINEARFPLETIRLPLEYDTEASASKRALAIVDKWISHQKLPVGILCDRDSTCQYVSHSLRRNGVHVPHEAALVGIGNEEVLCNNPKPTLSSIERGFDRIGFHAAELMDRMIEGENIPPQITYLPPGRLISRQSSDTLAMEDEIISSALRFIADECHHPIKVGDVARAAKVSYRTLERRFSETMDQTVINYINQQRVDRAKRLLSESDLLIKQIAKECGFADYRRMAYAFTNLIGVTPIVFREQTQRK